ncbi:amidoligase family protein, partial [Streptomyces mirabilis]
WAHAYHLASDVARYAGLHRDGGVYMDVDIAPGEVVLPARLPFMDPAGAPFFGAGLRDERELGAVLDLRELEPGWLARPAKRLSQRDARVLAVDLCYEWGAVGGNLIVAPPRSVFMKQVIESLPDVNTLRGLAPSALRKVGPDFGPDSLPVLTGSRLLRGHLEDYITERGNWPLDSSVDPYRQGLVRFDAAQRDLWRSLGWLTPESEFQPAQDVSRPLRWAPPTASVPNAPSTPLPRPPHVRPAALPGAGRLAARRHLYRVSADPEFASLHLSSGRARALATHASRVRRPGGVSYGSDPAAFDAVRRASTARTHAGGLWVSPRMHEVTDKLGSKRFGRPFGLELEFDFPRMMSLEQQNRARAAIAFTLHDAGLTSDREFTPPHTRADGYSADPNSWRLELDGSVEGGEIVSPLLHDTADTWRDLKIVLSVIRKYRGVASGRTGGHIHVGVGDFGSSVAAHHRLLALVAENEDVIYRLAQSPHRFHHRGLAYAAPNVVGHGQPATGAELIATNRRDDRFRPALNLSGVEGLLGGDSGQDHVEFRMFDGSLDIGVIQAQLILSLALVDTALREAGTTVPVQREPIGTHWWEAGQDGLRGRDLTPEQQCEAALSFRTFLDHVLVDPGCKELLAQLYFATQWPHPA